MYPLKGSNAYGQQSYSSQQAYSHPVLCCLCRTSAMQLLIVWSSLPISRFHIVSCRLEVVIQALRLAPLMGVRSILWDLGKVAC